MCRSSYIRLNTRTLSISCERLGDNHTHIDSGDVDILHHVACSDGVQYLQISYPAGKIQVLPHNAILFTIIHHRLPKSHMVHSNLYGHLGQDALLKSLGLLVPIKYWGYR